MRITTCGCLTAHAPERRKWLILLRVRETMIGLTCSVNYGNPGSLSHQTSKQRYYRDLFTVRFSWRTGNLRILPPFIHIFTRRLSVTEDDVILFVKLLSDWSELYKAQLSSLATMSTSSAPAILGLTKLLRNLCARVLHNQSRLL